jgi:hypothetical protein
VPEVVGLALDALLVLLAVPVEALADAAFAVDSADVPAAAGVSARLAAVAGAGVRALEVALSLPADGNLAGSLRAG